MKLYAKYRNYDNIHSMVLLNLAPYPGYYLGSEFWAFLLPSAVIRT
jgi:hypothetical protein